MSPENSSSSKPKSVPGEPRLKKEKKIESLITPLADASQEVRQAFDKFLDQLLSLDTSADTRKIDDLRKEALTSAQQYTKDQQILKVAIAVGCDLKATGWTFARRKDGLYLKLPNSIEKDPMAEKKRIRAAQHIERNNQLRDPAVEDFIRSMERRRLTANGWVSIFSLMRDGRDLSSKLRSAAKLPLGPEREANLQQSIQPYIQCVTPEAVCAHTELRLIHIWRYFRHTWTNPYNSIPGRSMYILIRDKAAEYHPVIGIAALASSVAELTPRDQWIGWKNDEFTKYMQGRPSLRWAKWIDESLRECIEEIYCKDFLESSLYRFCI